MRRSRRKEVERHRFEHGGGKVAVLRSGVPPREEKGGGEETPTVERLCFRACRLREIEFELMMNRFQGFGSVVVEVEKFEASSEGKIPNNSL